MRARLVVRRSLTTLRLPGSRWIVTVRKPRALIVARHASSVRSASER